MKKESEEKGEVKPDVNKPAQIRLHDEYLQVDKFKTYYKSSKKDFNPKVGYIIYNPSYFEEDAGKEK